MLRTNVYLTEAQDRAIRIKAAAFKKPKAQILREVIDEGLKVTPIQKSSSVEVFIKLAEVAQQFRGEGTGPKDLSMNLDKYIWDEQDK